MNFMFFFNVKLTVISGIYISVKTSLILLIYTHLKSLCQPKWKMLLLGWQTLFHVCSRYETVAFVIYYEMLLHLTQFSEPYFV